MSTAVELVRAVEAVGGRFRIEGETLVIAPRKAWEPVVDQLRQHKPAIIAGLRERELAAWRAPFVEWLDRYYTLHLGKQTGTGFRNLARRYRECEEGNGCPDEICRAMLKELCFEIRTVQGVELVQGLVLRSDLEAENDGRTR